MRALLILSPLLFAATAGAAAPTSPATNCQKTTSYLAEANGVYRGKGLAPHKLNQLPPAQGFKAVYRHIGGCEAPLMMSDYRRANRR